MARFTPTERLLIAGIALATILASGFGGLLVGAWYGGNYRSSREFNGVRGYEAFGQIGLCAGVLLGAVIGGTIAVAVVRALGRSRR